MDTKMFFKTAFLTLSVLNSTVFFKAAFAGGESGGGGDASEARVNEIRSDILSWINKGGASGLKLSIPQTVYEEDMKRILQNKAVEVSFTESKVEVSGKEKTCRGFFEQNKPQIICNISRFQNTKDADQYRLVHHEYAGLAGVEKNEDAASDYEISNQITDFLREEKVLRLSIKNSEFKYFSKPCGHFGSIDQRIKDCGDSRKSSFSQIPIFRKGQVHWSTVSESEFGIVILLNNRTNKMWAVRRYPVANEGYYEASKFCELLQNINEIPTRKWSLPTMRDLVQGGLNDNLMSNIGFHMYHNNFYWSKNTSYLKVAFSTLKNGDDSIFYESSAAYYERNGTAICVAAE